MGDLEMRNADLETVTNFTQAKARRTLPFAAPDQSAAVAHSRDAIGELTNMVAGNVKSKLCDLGLECAISVPAVVRGINLTIEPVRSDRRRVSLICQGNQVAVDVWTKPRP